jgi:hypothetical protein
MSFAALLLAFAALGSPDPPSSGVPASSCTIQAPASPNSDAFASAANDVDHQWEVTFSASGPVVARYSESVDWSRLPAFLAPEPEQRENLLGSVRAIPVSDGYLIGTNNGEWGGSAWWSDRLGKRHYALFDGNVLGFTKCGDDVVAVTGLAHMGLREGALFLLSRSGDRWFVSKEVPLDGAALAFTASSNSSLVVLTSQSLVEYRAGQLHTLGSVTDMSAFYPNSMVLHDDQYYVGMRHAVLRMSLHEGRLVTAWLIPPKV